MADTDSPRARLVGINHVALGVDDVDDALAFYRSVFEFDLRGRTERGAFLDMGDQFLALSETDAPAEDGGHGHVGVVVDDPGSVEERIADLDVERIPTAGLDFRDPWGNHLQVVAYADVQFTKADHVLRGMERADLDKSASALDELEEKGMAPDRPGE